MKGKIFLIVGFLIVGFVILSSLETAKPQEKIQERSQDNEKINTENILTEIPSDSFNPDLPVSDLKENPRNVTKCGIENCHGLDIICGSNPAQMCTMMYQLGDKCRQFAECGISDGACKFIENEKFLSCKSCAQKCESDFANEPEKAFSCESECGE